ncbi:mdtL, partial [Symbiodinium necroappetens]
TVAVCYALSVAVLCWICFRGLPKKQPQHPSVRHGGSTSLVLFLGTVYAFAYFATDQYVPSMPQMEVDLHGSQTLLSASVQLNLVVKAGSTTFLLVSSSLSLWVTVCHFANDDCGKLPVKAAKSFTDCGPHTTKTQLLSQEWFLGMGESVEPVVFAMARDFFPQREERPSEKKLVFLSRNF